MAKPFNVIVNFLSIFGVYNKKHTCSKITCPWFTYKWSYLKIRICAEVLHPKFYHLVLMEQSHWQVQESLVPLILILWYCNWSAKETHTFYWHKEMCVKQANASVVLEVVYTTVVRQYFRIKRIPWSFRNFCKRRPHQLHLIKKKKKQEISLHNYINNA